MELLVLCTFHPAWKTLIILNKDDVSDEKSDFSTSGDGSDTDIEGVSTDTQVSKNEAPKETASLSNVTRQKLLSAEPDKSSDIILHPILISEWMNYVKVFTKGMKWTTENAKRKSVSYAKKLWENSLKKEIST